MLQDNGNENWIYYVGLRVQGVQGLRENQKEQ